MAGKGRSGKDRNGGFINSEELLNILSLSGATLFGAVALFGVKKLYDYLSVRDTCIVQSPNSNNNCMFVNHSTSKQSLNKLIDLSPSIPDVIPRKEIFSPDIPYPEDEGYIDEKTKNIKKLEKLNFEKEETLSIASVLDEPEPCSKFYKNSGSTITNDNKLVNNLEDPFYFDLNEFNPRSTKLMDCLIKYHDQFMKTNESLLINRLQCVQEMKELFTDYYLELLPNHPIFKLQDLIDPTDPLHINSDNHFTVFIPLHLVSDQWELLDAGHTIHGSPGYSLLKRIQLAFFTQGTVPYDKYIIGGHLSPVNVKTAIRDMTNRVAKWGSFNKVQAAVFGPLIQLKVKYCYNDEITIDFVPKITIRNESIISIPHPFCNTNETLSVLWTQCYMKEENEKLITMYPNGCQLCLVQILRSLNTVHEELEIFTSKVCVSVVLHMMEQVEAWEEHFLGERFIETLLYITEHLQLGKLAYYFNPSYNLLTEFTSSSIALASNILDNIIKSDKYEILLNIDT